ncbi:hypothetical protein KVR01_007638 [Diaporthe batatas]|uniref:uncharacterized protein n=1 Tax=Diaporthe batatas TaxID=748121 RepID=UPI001D03D505|nr:uncharacterized protein KVR01_007638 [Diaporthe batatas]KAG8163160.1 hypothetical protein KVR01_007638 [Diaporthe batatas]
MKAVAVLAALTFGATSVMAACVYPNDWWCGSDGVTRYRCENGEAVVADVCQTGFGCVDLGLNVGAYCSSGTGP